MDPSCGENLESDLEIAESTTKPVELATGKGGRFRRVDFVSSSCFVTQAGGGSCRTIV